MLSTFSCVCWPSVYLLWRNVYLGLPPIFWLSFFFNIELHCIFWKLIPCHFHQFANIFSHSKGCLFMASFVVQKLLIRSHLFIFVFTFIILGGQKRVKKDVTPFCQREFCLCFLMRVLVSGFTFRWKHDF